MADYGILFVIAMVILLVVVKLADLAKMPLPGKVQLGLLVVIVLILIAFLSAGCRPSSLPAYPQ